MCPSRAPGRGVPYIVRTPQLNLNQRCLVMMAWCNSLIDKTEYILDYMQGQFYQQLSSSWTKCRVPSNKTKGGNKCMIWNLCWQALILFTVLLMNFKMWLCLCNCWTEEVHSLSTILIAFLSIHELRCSSIRPPYPKIDVHVQIRNSS